MNEYIVVSEIENIVPGLIGDSQVKTISRCRKRLFDTSFWDKLGGARLRFKGHLFVNNKIKH